jgi:hypothetical protein
MSDPLKPFRELMIPLSGVDKMSLLQRGDKKIFLIGDVYTPEFCRDKGFTPLCSILEDYLRTRTKDEPVDFMLEKDSGISMLERVRGINVPPPLDEIRTICSQHVNTDGDAILGLVRHMVDQYIPVKSRVQKIPSTRSRVLQYIQSRVLQYIQPKSSLPKTDVQLPNARVHWLDPISTLPRSKGDRLVNYMRINLEIHYDSDGRDSIMLYALRTIINDLLEIVPEDGIPWALRDPRVIDMFHNDPFGLHTFVVDPIPDRELFLQSSESSKIAFFEKVYHKLLDSNFFKKCYSGGRFIEWKIIRDTFIEGWRDTIVYKDNNTIEWFYFIVQRFLMDFFTCCRILKEEGRWYKNIVIYAGYVHTRNIERMLRLLDFKHIPLPPIHYDPECSGTRKQKRKRKTRRLVK